MTPPTTPPLHRRSPTPPVTTFAGLAAAAVLAVALAPAPARAAPGHGSHQHGVAQLAVAFEAGTLTIELDTPLDNLLGFERAPRTPAERSAADAAVARLRAADALFAVDPAAGCTLAEAALTSPALGLGGDAPAGAAADGHADLAGRFGFRCTAAPAWIDVGLFGAFPRLTRIEVQAATGRGQGKATLRKPRTGAARLTLPG